MAFAAPPPSAAWLHRDARTGFEVASFSPLDGGWRVEGCTAAVEAGQAWVVRYAVVLDEGWATRQARVWAQSGGASSSVTLTADGAGHWEVDGHPAPHLDGCLDVDLESSALTNAFPVHRLAWTGGGPVDDPIGGPIGAPAAYVRAAGLAVERLEQTYDRLGGGERPRFAYAAPGLGFTCELVYDESGLVLEYPGIAVRIPVTA